MRNLLIQLVNKKMGFKNFYKTGTYIAFVIALIVFSGNYALAQDAAGAVGDPASLSTTQPLESGTSDSDYKSATFYFLLFLLICLFTGVIGKVLKVYELTRSIQGKKETINWNRIQGTLFGIALIVSLYGTYWTYSEWGYTTTAEAGSIHGERLDFMLMITIVITTIVFIITHILLFGFAYVYPGSNKRKAYFYPHNNTVERIWTIVPAIVLTVLVLLGFFTWRSITNVPENEQKKAINIEVVGEQFKWNIRYAGADNQLGLRNYKLTTPTNFLGIDFKDRKSWDDKLSGEIVLPVNRSVRVTIGSKDILHSFYIPTMRVQINAVPGMPTYFQFTPRYTTQQMREKNGDPAFEYILLCNKICGQGHYNMKAKVRVVAQEEYNKWLEEQQLFYNDDMKNQLQVTQQKEEKGNTTIALKN